MTDEVESARRRIQSVPRTRHTAKTAPQKRGRVISAPTTQPPNFCAEDLRAILQSPLRPRLCFLPKTKRCPPRPQAYLNPREAHKKKPSPLGKVARRVPRKRRDG